MNCLAWPGLGFGLLTDCLIASTSEAGPVGQVLLDFAGLNFWNAHPLTFHPLFPAPMLSTFFSFFTLFFSLPLSYFDCARATRDCGTIGYDHTSIISTEVRVRIRGTENGVSRAASWFFPTAKQGGASKLKRPEPHPAQNSKIHHHHIPVTA